MEPVTGAVAIIGFAASIAQLAQLAIASCITLHSFYQDTSDAPKNVDRLVRLLSRLELIARRMQKVQSSSYNQVTNDEVTLLWKQHSWEMEHDLRTFRDKVARLEKGFRSKDRSLKSLFARLRVVFSENETARYERSFSSHIETATLMLSMTTSTTTDSILANTTSQSRKMDNLLRSAESLQAAIESESAGHQILASLGLNAGIKVTDHVVGALRDAPLSADSDVGAYQLSMLKDLPITDSCLSASSRYTEGHTNESRYPKLGNPRHRRASDVVFGKGTEYVSYGRPICSPLTTKASWQLSIYRYPIGVLTVYQARSSYQQNLPLGSDVDKQSAYTVTISLFPASWLATVAVRLSVELKFPSFGNPSLQTSFEQAAYNDDPEVLRCLTYADVDGFCRLLHDGKARATDLLPDSGNSLLHEVVFSYMAGRKGALELCHLLLQHGADPNSRNATGKTPLLACCQFMRDTIEHSERLRPVACALITHGANLAICDDSGYSACGVIFQCRTGLQFLQTFVYQHVDLFAMQEMASSDAWILASLARSLPEFKARLDAEFRSYRTVPKLSCSRYQEQHTMLEIDPDHQIIEVRRGSAVARTTFMSALCTSGTKDMVEPFLNCGLDLNELLPSQSSTYIRSAAKRGNLEVVAALADAGAAQYIQTKTYHQEQIGPVDELLERWYALNQGIPEYFGNPRDEIWILPKLLLHRTFDGTNVLFKAIETLQPPEICELLLDAGCGLRDGNPAITWKQKSYGSEIIEAVKCNSKVLALMLRYGLALERQDRLGFTALLHALDHGPGAVDSVQILITAGADLVSRTGSGFTPLQFAKRNLDQRHPRRPRASWTVSKGHIALDPVSYDADQHAYNALVQAIERQNGSTAFTAGHYMVLRPHLWCRTLTACSAWQSVYSTCSTESLYRKLAAKDKIHSLSTQLHGLIGLLPMVFLLFFASLWSRIWSICLINTQRARDQRAD